MTDPSQPQPVPIEVRGLVKTYDRRILDGLDLEIPAGSVVGLLGKNGSGKTTAIKCFLGLLQPSAGKVLLFGEESWSMSGACKARLGYVPQVVKFYPWMNVQQMLDYTAPFYPRWNVELVGDLLRDFAMDPKAKVATLSVGTKQKLAIILALGHEPDLLILDEPAASLDPIARRQFLSALLEVAADGRRTVLFSTHITSDLERVANRVAVLRNGRVAFHGELDELKDTVKRLHIRSDQVLPTPLALPGCLSIRMEGHDAVATVRGDWRQTIRDLERQHHAIVTVEDLNLEDIYLEIDHESVA